MPSIALSDLHSYRLVADSQGSCFFLLLLKGYYSNNTVILLVNRDTQINIWVILLCKTSPDYFNMKIQSSLSLYHRTVLSPYVASLKVFPLTPPPPPHTHSAWSPNGSAWECSRAQWWYFRHHSLWATECWNASCAGLHYHTAWRNCCSQTDAV